MGQNGTPMSGPGSTGDGTSSGSGGRSRAGATRVRPRPERAQPGSAGPSTSARLSLVPPTSGIDFADRAAALDRIPVLDPADPREREAERLAAALAGIGGQGPGLDGAAPGAGATAPPLWPTAGTGAAPDLSEALDPSEARPLPGILRTNFEAALGVVLSTVRVHHGPTTAAAAARLGARAFARGDDIGVGHGDFPPTTAEERELLGHELIHVAQNKSRPSPHIARSGNDDSDELDTDATSDEPTGVQIPWRGSVLGSLVRHFGPYALEPEDQIVADFQSVLVDREAVYTFTAEPDGDQEQPSLQTSDRARFEGAMNQAGREKWTIQHDILGHLLDAIDISRDRYDFLQSHPDLDRQIRVLDVLVNHDIPVLPLTMEAPTLELPPGADSDHIKALNRFMQDLFGQQGPTELAEGQSIHISSAELEAVAELEQLDATEREAVIDLLRPTGTREQVEGPVQLDNLIASAKAHREIQRMEREMGIQLDTDDDGPPPIVTRPVEGVIIWPNKGQSGQSVTVGMEVEFGFHVTNGVDAFRVPHVSIRWQAVRNPGRRERQIDSETTNYINVRPDGILNDRTFAVEFEHPGRHEIRAIIDHNFYTPNAVRQQLTVTTVQEKAEELTATGDEGIVADAGIRPDRPNRNFELGGIDDIGSYDEGYRYYGTLEDARFRAGTGSIEDSFRRIDNDIRRVENLIEHYEQRAEQGRDTGDFIAWANERIASLRATKSQIQGLSDDENSLPITVLGYYVSRTSGVGHRQLELAAWFRRIPTTVGNLYFGHLVDHSTVAKPQNLHFSTRAGSYEAMVERLFVKLSEDYPAGNMIVRFQLYDESTPTERIVTFERRTETNTGEIAAIVFSGPGGLVVNIAAALLTVFPPTTGLGITIGLAYNAASVAYEMGEAIESDTLSSRHAVDVGLLFLDLIPVGGRAIRGVAAAGRTIGRTGRTLAVGSHVAEFAGEVYVFSDNARIQIANIHSRHVDALAATYERILDLQSQHAPAALIEREQLTAQRQEQALRSAAIETLSTLVAEQAIQIATPRLAAKWAESRVPPRPGTDAAEVGPPPPEAETRLEAEPEVQPPTRPDAPTPEAEPETLPTAAGAPEGARRRPRPEEVSPTEREMEPLPDSVRIGGRMIRIVKTGRPGRSMGVRYDPDPNGLVTRIWIEADADARQLHLQEHRSTVRLMQRYQGLSGKIRIALARMRGAISRYLGLTDTPDLLPGSKAFDARAEIEKLQPIIRARANRLWLERDTLSALERAELMSEIDQLDHQLDQHMATFERLDMEASARYIAASDRQPRSNQAALDAGYPPLEQVPGHYYVRTPDGRFDLRRFTWSSDPRKRIDYEDGNPVVVDRTGSQRVVHEPPETLRPGETRTYTNPNGTTAIATRRADGAIIIESAIGPGRGRLGYEHAMFSGVEVGLPGWERAHSRGQGTGHESSFGILYAPSEVNQRYQRLGVEQYIRDLFLQVRPDVTLLLRTETKAHSGTQRLASITYRIDAVEGDTSVRLYEVGIEVQDSRTSPNVNIDAERYVDVERFLRPVQQRAQGTEPAPTRAPAPTTTPTGPMTPQANALVERLNAVVAAIPPDSPLAVYLPLLQDVHDAIRLDPASPTILDNAAMTIGDVERVLRRQPAGL